MVPVFVAVIAILIAISLLALVKKNQKPAGIPQPAQEELRGLDFDKFYELCCHLLEKLGLRIQEAFRISENSADILTENPTPIIGGLVIVHVLLYPDKGQASSMDVMNFASNLVGDRKGKGLFITTGTIAPEVALLPELPPIEFIDGARFSELLGQYSIEIEKRT